MDKRSPSPLPRQMDGDAGARRVVADADAAQPLQIAIPVTAIKGRGAASRLAHRFESTLRERFDDGWSGGQAGPAAPGAGNGVEAAVAADGTCRIAEGMPEPDRPPQTEVIWEDARSVLTRNDSPDLPLEVSLLSLIHI